MSELYGTRWSSDNSRTRSERVCMVRGVDAAPPFVCIQIEIDGSGLPVLCDDGGYSGDVVKKESIATNRVTSASSPVSAEASR